MIAEVRLPLEETEIDARVYSSEAQEGDDEKGEYGGYGGAVVRSFPPLFPSKVFRVSVFLILQRKSTPP